MSLDEVLRFATVPDEPDIFVLGCFERNVSIYLQQVRALNLVFALAQQNRLGRRICVIGGGFAGLTASAAASRQGCEVTVVERLDAFLGLQRGNRVRWIHPHIHEWPRPGSTDPHAGLPLLDWHADFAGHVATRIVEAWEGESRGVEAVLAARDLSLRREGTEWRVGWNGLPERCFDQIFLAVGLGVEKTFGPLPLHSYWADADIATIHPQKRSFLVSGIGEGGLIDVLYLRIRGFRHDATVADCLRDIASVEQQLLALEEGIHDLDVASASARLTAGYRALAIPAHVDACLHARLRSDTEVTLSGSSPNYLTPKADILNRFLISRLIETGAIRYRIGRLEEITALENSYDVKFDDKKTERYDRVLIRHGTDPDMRRGFRNFWDRYVPHRGGAEFQHVAPVWDTAFY